MQENPTTSTTPPAAPRQGTVYRHGSCGPGRSLKWACPSWCTTAHEDGPVWPPTHTADVGGLYVTDSVRVDAELQQEYDKPPVLIVMNFAPGDWSPGERFMLVRGNDIPAFAALMTTLGFDDLGAFIAEAAELLGKGADR
jgi:hypothetical protein